MSSSRLIVTLGCWALCLSPAFAGETWHQWLRTRACWPQCVGCFTCDDYCKKAPPCPPAPACLTCDDYCEKRPPCPPAPACFTCDDYCRKTFWFDCRPKHSASFLWAPRSTSAEPAVTIPQPDAAESR